VSNIHVESTQVPSLQQQLDKYIRWSTVIRAFAASANLRVIKINVFIIIIIIIIINIEVPVAKSSGWIVRLYIGLAPLALDLLLAQAPEACVERLFSLCGLLTAGSVIS